MAEVDTSSYVKPAALPVQKSALEQAQQYGNIQQQQQQIQQGQNVLDAQKMQNAHTALGHMIEAMGSLGPNATKEQYAAVAQNAVDQGLVPQQQENVFLQRLQLAKTPQEFYKQFMTSALDAKSQLDQHLGTNENQTNNQQTIAGVRNSPLMGGNFVPKTTIQNQLPVGAPTVDTRRTLPDGSPNPGYNQPGYTGPQVVPNAGVTQVSPNGAPLPVARPTAHPDRSRDRVRRKGRTHLS